MEDNLNNSAEVDSCYFLVPAEIDYVGIDPAGIGSVGIGSCCCYLYFSGDLFSCFDTLKRPVSV